jgi:hypothetical protein
LHLSVILTRMFGTSLILASLQNCGYCKFR